jgi:hypothetical protein
MATRDSRESVACGVDDLKAIREFIGNIRRHQRGLR